MALVVVATVAAVSFTPTTHIVSHSRFISSLHSVCNADGQSKLSAKLLLSEMSVLVQGMAVGAMVVARVAAMAAAMVHRQHGIENIYVAPEAQQSDSLSRTERRLPERRVSRGCSTSTAVSGTVPAAYAPILQEQSAPGCVRQAFRSSSGLMMRGRGGLPI